MQPGQSGPGCCPARWFPAVQCLCKGRAENSFPLAGITSPGLSSVQQQQGRGEIRGKNRRNRASPGAEAPAEMGPEPLKGVGGEGRTPEGQEESPVGAVACTEITFL